MGQGKQLLLLIGLIMKSHENHSPVQTQMKFLKLRYINPVIGKKQTPQAPGPVCDCYLCIPYSYDPDYPYDCSV